MRRGLVAAAAVLVLGGASAAGASKTRDDLDLLQSDVRDLQGRVTELQEGQAAILAALAELRRTVGLDDPGRATPADLAARMGGLEQDVRALLERQSEVDSQVSTLTDRLDAVYRYRTRLAQSESLLPDGAAGPGDAAVPGGAPEGMPASGSPGGAPAGTPEEPVAGGTGGEEPPALVDPEELYQAARADYGRGAYDLAIEGFQEFLGLFPTSDLADNAQYWIGECLWAQGKHAEALAAFSHVAEAWPQGDKVPDAELKKALSLLELNRTADGILQLQRVRDAWPESSAARLAQQKLQGLGLM